MVDNLEPEAAALRSLIYSAHTATKDLRAALREAQELLGKTIEKAMEEVIDETIVKGLDAYADTIRRAQAEAVDRVFREFDKLADELLGTSTKHRKRGEPSMGDLVEAKRQAEAEGAVVSVENLPNSAGGHAIVDHRDRDEVDR